MPTDHEFITPLEKTQRQTHPQTKESRVKSSQEPFSDREGISSRQQSVQGKGETFFRFSHLEEAARTVLEEQRDHLLAEAKSEVLKQECRADFLDCSFRELQRQAHSSRTEIEHTNLGFEESRREQSRLDVGATRKSPSRYSHQKYP